MQEEVQAHVTVDGSDDTRRVTDLLHRAQLMAERLQQEAQAEALSLIHI